MTKRNQQTTPRRQADLRDYFDKAGITWPTVEGYDLTLVRVDDEARTVTVIYADADSTGVHFEVEYEPDAAFRHLRASVGNHTGYVDMHEHGLGVLYRGDFEDHGHHHTERAWDHVVTRYSRRQLTDYVADLIATGWLAEAITRAVEALNTTHDAPDATETDPQPDNAPEVTETAPTPQTGTTYVEPGEDTTPAREGDYPLGTVATVEVPGHKESRGRARARRVSTYWFGERAMDLWQILDGEFAGFKFSDATVVEVHQTPADPETAPEPTEAAPGPETGSQVPETTHDGDGDELNELTVTTDGHPVAAEYLEQVAHLQLPDDDALDAATVVLGESVVDVVYPTHDGETRYRVLPRGYQLAVYYLRHDGTGEALGYVNMRQRYTGHRWTAYAGRQLVDAFDGGLSRMIRDDMRWRAANRGRLAHVTDATPVEPPADGILSHMVRAEGVQ